MARILSVTLRAAKVSHTARQTSMLHRIPRASASTGPSADFASAIFWAASPTGPVSRPENAMSATIVSAPARLPKYAKSQLRRRLARLTRPSTQAMTIRQLPVNSSAPATTTRISPVEKIKPPSSRAGPKPRPAPAMAAVKPAAPRAMKAPARNDRVAKGTAANAALLTPASSMRFATSTGL